MESLNNEFIDAYSDDLIYILEARRALFTHPLMSVSEKIADASFSRLYLVTAVSGVEIAMKKWSHRSVILNSDFSEKSTMEERINALYSAFQRVGINVDVEIFKDYLALRYLRALFYVENGRKMKRPGLKNEISLQISENSLRSISLEYTKLLKI